MLNASTRMMNQSIRMLPNWAMLQTDIKGHSSKGNKSSKVGITSENKTSQPLVKHSSRHMEPTTLTKRPKIK